MPLVEQELLTIPEPQNFFLCGAQSLVFCVVFCRSLFVLLSFIYNFYQSTSRNHIWSQKSNTPIPLEQELVNIPKHLFFCGVCVAQSLVFSVVFCRSLFVLLSFFWPLYCLSLTLLIMYIVYPFDIFKFFMYSSQRHSVINHCDRCITLLSDTDMSFGLFNPFTYSDKPFGW